jgi:hypothetical protein
MVIETKYEYIYYTIIQQNWFDEAERILNAELTTEILINVIERKLKNSRDCTLNIFKVDYSESCDDIQYWIHKHSQHKVRPVFVQIENNQPIVTSGTGTLIVLYEEDDDDDNYDSQEDIPPYDEGSIDSLNGAGGRL